MAPAPSSAPGPAPGPDSNTAPDPAPGALPPAPRSLRSGLGPAWPLRWWRGWRDTPPGRGPAPAPGDPAPPRRPGRAGSELAEGRAASSPARGEGPVLGVLSLAWRQTPDLTRHWPLATWLGGLTEHIVVRL